LAKYSFGAVLNQQQNENPGEMKDFISLQILSWASAFRSKANNAN